MRTLLCSLNSKYVHSSLSVWYLWESARAAGHSAGSILILECTVNQPAEEISQKIISHKPDILAISCYIWNIAMVRALIPKIKRSLPALRIILGGPEVSYNPKKLLMENPDMDYIVTGEGEIPFPLLLNALDQNSGVSGVPGLCFRDSGTIRCNLPIPAPPEPPSPYSKKHLAALQGRIAYLETSRGCPFSCAFCLSGGSGPGVRFFDLDRAKKNLLLLAGSGARTVKLVDRTFNCDPIRAYHLFRFIIQNAGSAIPLGVCFHFEVAADLFDSQTLALLASAPPGLIQLETGIQSFNPKTLKAVHRNTDVNKTEENIKKLIWAGNIHLHADLIAGLPYEDLASFARSFDRAYALHPHMLQLGFLKMLHGSSLREQARELKCRYSKTPPYEIKSTPWLSAEDVNLLSRTEYALGKLHNSGRFSLTLKYMLRASGRRPFDFFSGAGSALKKNPLSGRQSLDAFTRQAFDYFLTLPDVDKGMLRDVMVCDRIATGQKIPAFLKVADPALKKALHSIRSIYCNGKTDGKINGAMLYTGKKRAVFSFGEKNPVTGRILLRFL